MPAQGRDKPFLLCSCSFYGKVNLRRTATAASNVKREHMMTQKHDEVMGTPGIIFNWGEYLGKRVNYVLKYMGYGTMTVYPQRGQNPADDYVVFDYADRDILFFVRNGLVVEIRFLVNYAEKVFNLGMGMTREQVEASVGKPDRTLKASEVGFGKPFAHVFVYSDMERFDFTLEVLFDAQWLASQINIYP